MVWKPIVNSQTADAADMNDNFNLVAAGTREPRSSAGVSFATTDSVYDIGGSSSRWDTAYINNLDITGSVTTEDKNLWLLNSEVTLSATASSVEFTGLNGDDVGSYMIVGRPVTLETGSSLRVGLSINGDSNGNFGVQYLRGRSNSIASFRSTTLDDIYLCGYTNYGGGASGEQVNLFKSMLYAKTGSERTVITNSLWSGSGTSIFQVESIAGIWNDTSSTITSVKIIVTSAGGLVTGTNFQLWARK